MWDLLGLVADAAFRVVYWRVYASGLIGGLIGVMLQSGREHPGLAVPIVLIFVGLITGVIWHSRSDDGV